MEMSNILSADVLDIIFDQRNKEYGAYDLRKNYQRRLTKSLMITLLVVVLLCLTYILLGSMKNGSDKFLVTPDIMLTTIPPEAKTVLPPPPPALPPPPPSVKTLDYTNPLIMKEPPENERPPEQKDLDNVQIGTANILQGSDDVGITPPVEIAKGIVDPPKKLDDDGIYIGRVEIESQYPGGFEAWKAFLGKNLSYPQDAVDIDLQGTVIIQFIVDKEGNVSDVTAISGPEQLRSAAVSVIKKSGKWTAAIQNGRKVKSYKRQPITFRLAADQ